MKTENIYTNAESIKFNYSNEDLLLFNDDQKRHQKNIEEFYIKLRARCLSEVEIPISASHKVWITSRVNQHVTSSLMRLLYLAESYCDSALKFNAAGCAVTIKAMLEIPFHLGYLTWILDQQQTFGGIRAELGKIAFGEKDPASKLTGRSKISQKVFHQRADEMMKKFFQSKPSDIKIFETIYKEANATGHHNSEGRMLVGWKNDDTWRAKDRKEAFV
ncbi:MAG TPA: hypothetical protein VLB83_02260, partial [Candidatus Paceibacterota bacterium]|nr:hypothetical protein [Candidatus Paceibacterota bacterium]